MTGRESAKHGLLPIQGSVSTGALRGSRPFAAGIKRSNCTEGISIKVLCEDKAKGEMTCLLKWEPGATLPMHKHPEIEQTWVLEGSFYDHDGICRAGEFVWRHTGSFHQTHSDEGAVILAIYRKPNVFQDGAGYSRKNC
jgi:anti-sigma factor ChrR (cupin superfamily)